MAWLSHKNVLAAEYDPLDWQQSAEFEKHLHDIRRCYHQRRLTAALHLHQAVHPRLLDQTLHPSARQLARYWYLGGSITFAQHKWFSAYDAFSAAKASLHTIDDIAQLDIECHLAYLSIQGQDFQQGSLHCNTVVALLEKILAYNMDACDQHSYRALLAEALARQAYHYLALAEYDKAEQQLNAALILVKQELFQHDFRNKFSGLAHVYLLDSYTPWDMVASELSFAPLLDRYLQQSLNTAEPLSLYWPRASFYTLYVWTLYQYYQQRLKIATGVDSYQQCYLRVQELADVFLAFEGIIPLEQGIFSLLGDIPFAAFQESFTPDSRDLWNEFLQRGIKKAYQCWTLPMSSRLYQSTLPYLRQQLRLMGRITQQSLRAQPSFDGVRMALRKHIDKIQASNLTDERQQHLLGRAYLLRAMLSSERADFRQAGHDLAAAQDVFNSGWKQPFLPRMQEIELLQEVVAKKRSR